MASITDVIFSASLFEMSKPKYSSIAKTSSTPSSESKPRSSNDAVRANFSCLHFAAYFKTSKTFPSTYSITSFSLSCCEENRMNVAHVGKTGEKRTFTAYL